MLIAIKARVIADTSSLIARDSRSISLGRSSSSSSHSRSTRRTRRRCSRQVVLRIASWTSPVLHRASTSGLIPCGSSSRLRVGKITGYGFSVGSVLTVDPVAFGVVAAVGISTCFGLDSDYCLAWDSLLHSAEEGCNDDRPECRSRGVSDR